MTAISNRRNWHKCIAICVTMRVYFKLNNNACSVTHQRPYCDNRLSSSYKNRGIYKTISFFGLFPARLVGLETILYH